MQNYVGTVLELRLEGGKTTARISCPDKAIPVPGQYLLAHSPGDTDATLAGALYATERNTTSFIAAPPIPKTWQPGTSLILRGPLGKGFRPPARVGNLALASFSDTPARLLPLINHAESPALFTFSPPHLFSSSLFLPTSLEILPLSELPTALPWADFLALDLPLERIPDLPKLLGLTNDHSLPCPAQALVITPMPCGSLADCGVCAVSIRRNYKLACKDGPVFDLKDLLQKNYFRER
jgi:dihydroorotate dehydrogenase electron transfer subunit